MSRLKNPTLSFDTIADDLVRGVTDLCDERSNKWISIEEFISEYLDLGISPSIQQISLLKAFYGEELTLEERGVLEYWKAESKTTWEPDKPYQYLVLESGRRSGKTSVCAGVIGAYEFFKLCRLPNPQQHYGIAKTTTISILCLATQSTQGQRTIFGDLKAIIEQSPYFKRLIDSQQIKLLEDEIKYPSKRLAIYAGNSKSGSQVGGTMKALIMDEVARFANESGVQNALELWSNLGAATVTFGYEAVKVAVSSAWCEGDAIQVLGERAAYTDRMLGFRLCSWELNPAKASRDNPVIMADYAADPIKAALEYESIRPAMVDSFFLMQEIDRAPRRRSPIVLVPGEVELAGEQLRTVKIREIESYTGLSVAHLDPSLGRDGYALAVGHNEFTEDGLPIVVIDTLGLWQKEHKQSIYLADVEKVVLEIHRSRPLAKLTADHYGSGADTLQRLKMQGLKTEVVYYSNKLQKMAYELMRQLLHQRRLVLPGDNYWTPTLIRELSRIQILRNEKIDHPPGVGESKDLADAIAGVVWELSQRAHKDLGTRTPFTPTLAPATGFNRERLDRKANYRAYRQRI